jgi:lipid-A-disaccharide synthase
MRSYPRIFIAAGEHSGDQFGAALAGALRARDPDVRLSGLGGPRMSAAGVRIVGDTVSHAGMGFFYTLAKVAHWARIFRRSVAEFNHEAPDVLVPIDNPGFNLRLAALAKERRIPVCYYVSPQVWAWRPGRIHRIGRCVDRMMTLFPFEKPLWERAGVDCRHVGHPLLDYMPARRLDDAFVAELRSACSIGLLPGSRSQEVKHCFPIICDAAVALRQARADIRLHVAAATAEHVAQIQAILASRGLEAAVHLNRTPEIMKGSRLCLVVSGTATLETAWHHTPMVVVYRAGAWARHLAPRMLHVRNICLVNILAGREIVPEHLLFNDDPRPVSESAVKLLQDLMAWEQCRRDLESVILSLGPPGSSARAAEAVMEMVR